MFWNFFGNFQRMDMETSRPAAGTASATWWAHWRPRLATSKRVNATASRASAHSPAISAWKTITISPLTAVKVKNIFYFYIRAHPVCLLLRRFLCLSWLKLNKTKTGEKRNNKFPFERENVSTHVKMACQKSFNQKFLNFRLRKLSTTFDVATNSPPKKKKKVSGFSYLLQLYSSSHCWLATRAPMNRRPAYIKKMFNNQLMMWTPGW